jgi:hypothetical protein
VAQWKRETNTKAKYPFVMIKKIRPKSGVFCLIYPLPFRQKKDWNTPIFSQKIGKKTPKNMIK